MTGRGVAPRVPQLVRNLGVSTMGSVLPAAVGALGTALVGWAGPRQYAVTVLAAWTLIGYLSLTDFGLTRSASKLVAEGAHGVDEVVGALWRTAIPLGLLLACGVVAVVMFAGLDQSLLALAVVPVASVLQFPVVGALEATGRFAVIGLQRLANAVFVYLIPALLIAFPGDYSGVVVALVVMATYRVVVVGVLAGRLGLRPVRIIRDAAPGGRLQHLGVHRVLTWVGLSSILGPLMLYADRVALWWAGVPETTWVSYVTLSELLIKTYVLPSAALAVLFPWFTRHRERRATLQRMVFVRVLPVVTALALTAGVPIVLWLSATVLHGLVGGSGAPGAVVVLLAAGTLVNWSSQAYIAVLQVHDRQRLVVLVQIVFVLPYLIALWAVPSLVAPATGIAAVWACRIALTFLVLVAATARLLQRGPARQGLPVSREECT